MLAVLMLAVLMLPVWMLPVWILEKGTKTLPGNGGWFGVILEEMAS